MENGGKRDKGRRRWKGDHLELVDFSASRSFLYNRTIPQSTENIPVHPTGLRTRAVVTMHLGRKTQTYARYKFYISN